MAARRQDAWEAQLKEKAFLSATTKPIVDDTVTFKPPIPCALREVKRSMDKGIHFKDNTYGLAGIAGDPHATALPEYGDWAQWAQIPAGSLDLLESAGFGVDGLPTSLVGSTWLSN